MKNEKKSTIVSAIIGTIIGFTVAWYCGPRIIEEHQHWCDGVEVIREIKK